MPPRTIKIAALVSVPALIFIGLAAYRLSGKASPAERRKSMDQYTVAYEMKFEDLDPHSFTSLSKYVILRQMFETLVRLDQSLNVVPGIAENWRIDSKSGEITFYLRNVTFHDGSTLTANDVKSSLQRALSLGALQWPSSRFYDKKDAAKAPSGFAVVFDERTLKIKAPPDEAEGLLRSLSLIYAGIGKPSAASPNGFVGSGPYRLAAYDKVSGSVQLEKFPGYYRAVRQPRRLDFTWISAQKILEAFEREEIDEFDTGNYPFEDNAAVPGRKVALYFPMTRFLVFNQRSRVFGDIENRRAFIAAWPKKEISKDVYPFRAAATGLIPKGLLGHLKEDEARFPAAKHVLDADVTIGTGNKPEAAALERELAHHAPGLRVQLRVYSHQERIVADIVNGSLDGRIFGNSPKDFDARSLLATFTSRHPINIYGIKDAAYDKMIGSLNIKEEHAREAALKKADRHLLEKAYLLPLTYAQNYRIVHRDCPEYICGDHFQIWDRQYISE